MSKEQTYITAEEIEEAKNFMLMPEHSTKSLPLLIALFVKQKSQAKVLEALEREFSKIKIKERLADSAGDYIGETSIVFNGKEYYETEVRPKYE